METADRIIHQFYEAADTPDYWPDCWSSACDDLSEMVGGGAVHLWLASTETGQEYVSLFSRGDPQFAAEYANDYAAIDFRVPRVMARGLGEFADEREYVTSDEALRSPIHQQLLPRYGVHNISGANMCLDGCIGWFGISTRTADTQFDDVRIRRLKHISKHLLNALRIARSRQDFQGSRTLAFNCLDLVNVALLVFESGEPIYVNKAARQLLDKGFFYLRRGVLSCAGTIESGKMTRFFQAPANGAGEQTVLLRDADGCGYLVRVHDLEPSFPARGHRSSRHRVVSIVELNPSTRNELDDVGGFCSAFGVSPSEAKAIHAVLTSVSLAEFARGRGISLNTAQQQLKSAMRKIELNSQKKIFQAYERYRIVDGRSD